MLQLLEALNQAALILDRRGRIAAETSAFASLVANCPDASLARTLAPRLLVMNGLAGTRRDAVVAPTEFPSLAARVGGLQLELRLLPSPLTVARDAASVVIVALRPHALSTEEFLSAHYRLTTREIPVAMLLGQGLGVARIAERLAISAHTVRRHGESIYRKLDVRSRAALAAAITRVSMMLLENEGAVRARGS